MRDEVKKIVNQDIITLSELAAELGANPVLIYKYVVTDGVCEHLRIGKSHVVIDREDIELVRQRITRSNAFKQSRGAK